MLVRTITQPKKPPQVQKPKPAPRHIAKQVQKNKSPKPLKSKPTIKPKALTEIAQSFEAFDIGSEKRQEKPLFIPQKIKPKEKKQFQLEIEDASYHEYLISFLQNSLELPEYGEIKAKLTIDRFGRLLTCEIIDSRSKKNSQVLKNRLPELVYPCLNDYGILDATQTFTITFKNAEIR